MNHNRQLLLVILAAGLFMLFGCSGDDDDSHFTVYGKSSADAELMTPDDRENVLVDTDIVVRFDEEMEMGSINRTNFTVARDAGSYLDGTFTFTSDNQSVYFDPSEDLDPSTDYTVTIAGTVKDARGNLFKGKSWTFTTRAPSEINNSFAFGPADGGFSRVNVFTKIINDSMCDVTVEVLDREGYAWDSRNYTLDISSDTELKFYYLDEKQTYSYSDSSGQVLAMQRYFLDLGITSNNGDRSWNVMGSGADNQVIEPIRRLYLPGDAQTLIIREKKDESLEILDVGTGIDETTDAYMNSQSIVNGTTTVGNLDWNWWNCDGIQCDMDTSVSMFVGVDPMNPNDYIHYLPEISRLEDWNSMVFAVTDAFNYNSGEIQLNYNNGSINFTKFNYNFVSYSGSDFVTTLYDCPVDGWNSGSVAAYVGDTHAAFVQFVSSTESAFDTATVNLAWYEKINNAWQYQGEINSSVVTQDSTHDYSSEGITGLRLSVEDSDSSAMHCYDSLSTTVLRVIVPYPWN